MGFEFMEKGLLPNIAATLQQHIIEATLTRYDKKQTL